jgi:hypothetical protein
MAESIPEFGGLTLAKIGDLGLKVMATPGDSTTPSPPGEPIDEEIFQRPPAHLPTEAK